MTKKELKQKMLWFIAIQDDTCKEEWYDTDQGIYLQVMQDFATRLNIDLLKESDH